MKKLFEEVQQYMLLETTNGTAVFVLKAPLREVQLHARILACKNPAARYIAPPVEGRSFAKLSHNELLHLVYSLGGDPEVEYADLVQQALALVEKQPGDDTSKERLEREADRLGAPEPTLVKPEKVAAPKPPKEKKHDTSFANPERPKAGTTTALVWELCDALKQTLGRLPTSKEALAACEQEGIKAGTVSVQFGKWKKVQ